MWDAVQPSRGVGPRLVPSRQMWNRLVRRVGPAAASAVAAAWLLVSGGRARGRHAAAWRALRERDEAGFTRFQREAEARARAALARHGVAVVERRVERGDPGSGAPASGAPVVSVTLHTSRAGLAIALHDTEATVVAGGVARTAEEWDTPSPDDAFAPLLAAVEWGVQASQAHAV
jgi:hypothetical protein